MDRFINIMLLHALGDTIGFKNGDWEFNYFIYEKLMTLDYVNEMIYEFIDLGGVNGIDLKDWRISDDTLFHEAIAMSMLKYKKVTDKFINIVKTEMYKIALRILDDKKNKIDRRVGDTTMKNVLHFTPQRDARNEDFDSYAGGNGCAMRCLIIGACLCGEENRDELIRCSIVTSQLTHNNPIGYLGGYTSALFTALAIELTPIEKWPYILVESLQTEQIKQYTDMNNLDMSWSYNQYLRFWKKYIDTRFIDGKPIRNKSTVNPMYRIRYYHDNFFKDTGSLQIGASGYLCMIMAYDCLLDCDGKWEKVIVYGMLHSGDSDTIGCVAGGLYGAIYGMGDVPKQMLKYLEDKDELIDLAKKLYKKFSTS